MINITQCELEQFIGKNRSCVGKSEQGMICEDGPQTHGARMKDSFSAEATQTGVSMYNIDLLSNDNISEYGEE
jgi:hypothetical protein